MAYGILVLSATTPGNGTVSGHILYSGLINPSYLQLNISEDLNNLLEAYPYVPPGGFAYLRRYRWFMHTYFNDISANATKFKSALPKLDYGQYNVTWQGVNTAEGFLNYASQEIATYYCWSAFDPPSFPGQVVDSPTVTGAEITNLSYAYGGEYLQRGDTAYLQFSPFYNAEFQVRVYFEAEAYISAVPASFGYF